MGKWVMGMGKNNRKLYPMETAENQYYKFMESVKMKMHSIERVENDTCTRNAIWF